MIIQDVLDKTKSVKLLLSVKHGKFSVHPVRVTILSVSFYFYEHKIFVLSRNHLENWTKDL